MIIVYTYSNFRFLRALIRHEEPQGLAELVEERSFLVAKYIIYKQ
jgi:hypothetical protein